MKNKLILASIILAASGCTQMRSYQVSGLDCTHVSDAHFWGTAQTVTCLDAKKSLVLPPVVAGTSGADIGIAIGQIGATVGAGVVVGNAIRHGGDTMNQSQMQNQSIGRMPMHGPVD